MELTDSGGVLIFTDWYLPGYKAGGPISSISGLTRALDRQATFHIACGDRDYLDTEPYAGVPTDTWIDTESARVCYISPSKRTYKDITTVIRNSPCNCVYINGIFSKSFSIFPLFAARKLGKKVIVAPRGMLAPGALSIKKRKKKAFIKLLRSLGIYDHVIFHATHHHEANHIRKRISPNAQIIVLPNIPKHVVPAAPVVSTVAGTFEILTIARVAPEKNLRYALEIMSRVRTARQVHWTIAGPVYDQGYMAECRALEVLLPPNIHVSWCGAQPPKEIEALVQRSHLFFLPTLGENFGHAIAEALLAGIPALIANTTPWTDLETKGLGWDYPLEQQEAFLSRLEHCCNQDMNWFANHRQLIAEEAAKIVKLPETIDGYKTLFS